MGSRGASRGRLPWRAWPLCVELVEMFGFCPGCAPEEDNLGLLCRGNLGKAFYLFPDVPKAVNRLSHDRRILFLTQSVPGLCGEPKTLLFFCRCIWSFSYAGTLPTISPLLLLRVQHPFPMESRPTHCVFLEHSR